MDPKVVDNRISQLTPEKIREMVETVAREGKGPVVGVTDGRMILPGGQSKPLPNSGPEVPLEQRLEAFRAEVNRIWNRRAIATLVTACGRAVGVVIPPKPLVIS